MFSADPPVYIFDMSDDLFLSASSAAVYIYKRDRVVGACKWWDVADIWGLVIGKFANWQKIWKVG